jgi:glycosyltransferase involved in cell wall biosynthesis
MSDRPQPDLPIIAFSKDWSESATANHHVLRQLAQARKVVWLNSIAMRRPRLSSGRDLRKIGRKLTAFTRGAIEVEKNLWVYTPLVLPFPHSPLASAINRQILRATVGALRKRLGIGAFELWSFLPTAGNYLGMLGESLLVYYCTDEYSLFSYVDERGTLMAERPLVEQADVVFATSAALLERKRVVNPATFLADHGVDHALFATALDPATAVPVELARLPRPIVGYYGTLQDWVDLSLIDRLATVHPEWSIVLIGPALVDTSTLRRHQNLHLLGPRPHAELPAYCKGFSVAMIPYLLGERMNYVNPVKLREYLSAGLPVVSTAVPEVLRYRDHCAVAQDHQEFEAAVVRALSADSPDARRSRSDAMRGQTWARKVAELCATTDHIRLERDRVATHGRRVASP